MDRSRYWRVLLIETDEAIERVVLAVRADRAQFCTPLPERAMILDVGASTAVARATPRRPHQVR